MDKKYYESDFNKLVPEQNKGKLPFTLFWQSLDGRLQLKEYDNLQDAVTHVKHLRKLGRKPILFARLIIDE